ncbi:MAG: nucleotidyltransferase family protein [Saprospiraceae bacterium]|nr:nucleotidyltransferase family protein [Saprospiraceae bacterium]
MNNDIAIVLLAAGASSRLGRAKQLLKYKGDVLINNVIEHSKKVVAETNVYVVLGAHADDIRKNIKDDAVRIVINNNWKEGMGSSIRSGIAKVKTNSDMQACILSVIDQPYLNAEVFADIIQLYRENKPKIISSRYRNVYGPPTLFGRQYFDDLLRLEGDKGAKAIIKSESNNVIFYNWDKGLIDIDEKDHLIHLM